ncbi:MAG TPA: NYN domain-containing protein, partial [Trebonia sp.]|nr:NYN domain-containing protein [Trebonia sp.]
MDRCALFVDAGYVLADGAMAVHGTRRRESVTWDYAGLLQFLAGLAASRSGLPLLRCYWYEATVEGRRGADHDALADLPGVKLRLAKMRPGRREGVESEIHRDLATLAQNKAVSDAMVVSAEEDLASVIADVQDLGMRVTMLHITSDGNWTISRTLRQECDDIVEISASDLRPYVDLISGAEPSEQAESAASAAAAPVGERDGIARDGIARDGAAREASRPAANGHGQQARPEHAEPELAGVGAPAPALNGAGLGGTALGGIGFGEGGLPGSGLAAAGLVSSGLGTANGLVPVGLPAGARPMPSFTPASAGSNGYQDPGQFDGGYLDVPPAPGSRNENSTRPDAPPAAPSPYDDPAAMYPGLRSSGPMAPVAMPSAMPAQGPQLPGPGTPAGSRPDYSMPPGSMPGGHPDLSPARLPQAPSAGQLPPALPPAPGGPLDPGQLRPDSFRPQDGLGGNGIPGPQGTTGAPAGQDLYPAPVPLGPPAPAGIASATGAPGTAGLPGAVSHPAMGAFPGASLPGAGMPGAPAADGPGAAGGEHGYDLPGSRAYVSQDLSGYSPGAHREAAGREYLVPEGGQGDPARPFALPNPA